MLSSLRPVRSRFAAVDAADDDRLVKNRSKETCRCGTDDETRSTMLCRRGRNRIWRMVSSVIVSCLVEAVAEEDAEGWGGTRVEYRKWMVRGSLRLLSGTGRDLGASDVSRSVR